MTTTVQVLPRFSLCYRGKYYGPSEMVEVSDDAATDWRAWGSVEPVEDPRKRGAS